jgi:iron complex transport system substrate-binding protein
MKSYIFIFHLSFLLFVSCAIGSDNNLKDNESILLNECASEIELDFAKKFSIFETDYGFILNLHEENLNRPYRRYYLVRNDSVNVPSDGIKINIPISRLATNTSTVFEFLKLLDVSSSIKATCSKEYIYSQDICRAIDEGKILSLGSSYQLNRERLLSVSPELLLLSDEIDVPQAISFPILYSWEWKENSSLARAEWIKLWGVLFDKLPMADSLFNETLNKYVELKNRVTSSVFSQPTVFAGSSYAGTWYLTGGDGFMAELYEDAGANFLLSDTMIGTVACGLEWLVLHFSEADYWLNFGESSLKNIDERLLFFKSVQKQQVYHFLKRSKNSEGVGISDFFESAVAHPDIVLADVISVLHPQLLPNYQTIYIDKCKGGEK